MIRAVLLGGKKARGRVALIDDDDWPLVTGYPWWLHEYRPKSEHRDRPGLKRQAKGPYAMSYRLRDDGRQTGIMMHKVITGWAQTDHINHDGLDNRRSNLRPVTTAQNQQNRRSAVNSSSRYKGVSQNRSQRLHGKWWAKIVINGTHQHLGTFDSEEEAALTYNAAALEAFGPYAFLNQIGAVGVEAA